MRPFKSAFTWAAVVGETWPDLLADSATMGLPNVRSRSCATPCFGQREPIGIEPRRGEIRYAAVGLLGKTSVSGPGQNACANNSAIGLNTASRRAASSP